MKNLQEIMNEMNNLSEQIAVTLNDEEVKLSSDGGSSPCPPAPLALPTCDTNTLNKVSFCCAVNIPEPFIPEDTPDIEARIIYDLSCLKVIVEDCCDNFPACSGRTLSVPAYNIKIVGCIPFIVNVPLDPDSTDYTCVATSAGGYRSKTVSACCSGSVCVDYVLATVCSERAALHASCKVQLNCKTVCVENITPTYIDNCYVVVKGNFLLPTFS